MTFRCKVLTEPDDGESCVGCEQIIVIDDEVEIVGIDIFHVDCIDEMNMPEIELYQQ